MEATGKIGNRRAVSPVIATVILVAVAITVSVAVAYWMGGIAGQYTSFEKIEVRAHYSKYTTETLAILTMAGEVIAIGDGAADTFTGTLAYTPIVLGTLTITDGVEIFVDPTPFEGTLVGDKGGSGIIDYETGDYSVTFIAAPGDGTAITADYSYEVGGWKEYIDLKNSGSADATICNVFINNVPLKDYAGVTLTYDGTTVPDLADISIPIGKGAEVSLVITVPEGTEGCTHGTTIDMKIATAAGNQYPILEKLQ